MKNLLKKVLTSSGVVPSIIIRRKASYVLMFHGISGGRSAESSFTRMLDSLGRCFRFGALDELLTDRVDAGEPRVWLTFDDGLRNHFTCVYKILRQRSVPATFYVCPELIETGNWLWTHEMRARLRSLEPRCMARVSLELLGSELGHQETIRVMKGLPIVKRRELERQVRLATPDFQPTRAQKDAFDLMNWDELRQLDPELITIGSHSMSHAMLDSVTFEEAEYEIVSSRSALEEKLGREVTHFCYPAGQHGRLADSFVRKTYRTATTTQRALLNGEPLDRYRLPRVSASACPAQTMWSIAGTLHSQMNPPWAEA